MLTQCYVCYASSCLSLPSLRASHGRNHAAHSRGRVLAHAAQVDASLEASRERVIRQLDGLNRGIFGVQSAKQKEIHESIAALEAQNPTPCPTEDMQSLDGSWRLLYSTIRILGTKRSKLGLREFVQVGDLFQDIDVANNTAVNRVDFSVTGFSALKGCLTITAGYNVVSESRVDVAFQRAELEPDQLEQLFRKNYDLLLAIFNPEGWLDITYFDGEFRIGRDDKDNIFVLERC